MRLTVVIPTLNEAAALPTTLAQAQAVPEVQEILVSDGGSQDATQSIAEAAGARWITGERGRGAQLRVGATAATGDVIVLVHADTWLPPDAGRSIAAALAPTGNESVSRGSCAPVVGGGFHKVFRDAPWLLRSTARWRSAAYFHLTGRLFGDQAIFVRREVLAAIGGIPSLPLMEEFALCRALQTQGRLALASATVSTSARRFERHGVLRTWWLMARLQWSWRRGATPEELARQYARSSDRH